MCLYKKYSSNICGNKNFVLWEKCCAFERNVTSVVCYDACSLRTRGKWTFLADALASAQTHLRTLSLFRKAASAVTIDERLRVLLNTSAAVLSWTLVASYEHASLYFMLTYRFFWSARQQLLCRGFALTRFATADYSQEAATFPTTSKFVFYGL